MIVVIGQTTFGVVIKTLPTSGQGLKNSDNGLEIKKPQLVHFKKGH